MTTSVSCSQMNHECAENPTINVFSVKPAELCPSRRFEELLLCKVLVPWDVFIIV